MSEVLSPDNVNKPVTPKTADDVNDLFKDIDKEEIPAPKEKKEPKAKEDDEEADVDDSKDKDDDDIELVDEEDDIEKIDLTKNDDDVDIEAPPRKREILKKYPDIFKDFPFMEKIMYRDKQYNELFGSFDDAKEIAEKAEVFNSFESQLLSGNTEEILKNVKETDSKAFDNIVDNYLVTLAKVDKEAYFEVVGNINKRLIIEMVKEANETGNDDLKQAALLINQFVFASSKFTEPTKRVNKSTADEEKTSEAEKERLSFVQERFESARGDLQSRVDNTLKATISEYIDPKNIMTSYIKKNAITDAIRILNSSISSDSSVGTNLDKLWRAAFEAKFSKESLGKIQSYYLSKAKPALKNAILKARAEALKDYTPRKKEEKEETEEETTPAKTRNIAPGNPSRPKSKSEMKKGETVTDYFMRD